MLHPFLKGSKMDNNDIKLVAKGLALSSYGVDVSTMSAYDIMNSYWSSSSKKLITKVIDSVKTITLKFTDDAWAMLDVFGGPYIEINGREFAVSNEEKLTEEGRTHIIEINKEVLTSMIQIMYANKQSMFLSVPLTTLDPERKERVAKECAEFDMDSVHCSMKDTLARDNVRQNLEVLLTIAEYPEEVSRAVLKYYDEDYDFSEVLPHIKSDKYFIKDNRLYIAVTPDMRASLEDFMRRERITSSGNDVNNWRWIVISKNAYDYFWCSQGSEIQSCYSLDSDYRGGYGMYPMSYLKGHFMVYCTTGVATDYSFINGIKWACPRIWARWWAWQRTDDKLMSDYLYIAASLGRFTKYVEDLCSQVFDIPYTELKDDWHKVKYAKDYWDYYSAHKLTFYSDSVKVSNYFIDFKIKGVRDKVGSNYFAKSVSLKASASGINNIPSTFKYTKVFKILNGTITGLKKCPVTGMYIEEDVDKHYIAKEFKNPVNGCALLTYIDGFVKLDTCSTHSYASDLICNMNAGGASYFGSSEANLTPQFTSSSIPPTKFKNTLTKMVKQQKIYEVVVVRSIENGRISYNKFWRDK